MEKIKVTNEQYYKISELQASLYWRKVFNIDKSIQGEEREELKRKFDNEFNLYMAQYEIIPFVINTENEELKNIINDLCYKESIENNGVLYTGTTLTNDKILEFVNKNNYKFIEYNYNTIAAYNTKDKTLIQYCEGDIYINVFDNSKAFDNELNRVKNWYKENY